MLLSYALKLKASNVKKIWEYDFKDKVAGSVVECPMKLYRNVSSTLDAPNIISDSFTTGYNEDTSQTNLDAIKTQNNISRTLNGIQNQQLSKLMAELDLTPLCNSLFGGSNSALKSALKSIQADVWAQGSGASGGVLTNGVDARLYVDGGTTPRWASSKFSDTQGVSWQSNTSNSIVKMNINRNVSPDLIINNSNKLYILIASQYASDGTIPSSVSMDYLKITIELK